MAIFQDTSKLCSDFLREGYPGLKASHARELVAAFFGYKSHAALLADTGCSAEFVDQAAIIMRAPAIDMLYERKERLNELSGNVPLPEELTDELIQFLQDDDLFTGEVWDCDDLEEFILEKFLPEHVEPDLDVELAEVIAETNAYFDDVDYDKVEVDEDKNGMTIKVTGTYSGTTHEDMAFCGDTIDFEVEIYLARAAGRIGYEEPEIEVRGAVRRDFYDLDHEEGEPAST